MFGNIGGLLSGGNLTALASSLMTCATPLGMAQTIASQFGMSNLFNGLFNSGIAQMANTASSAIDNSGLASFIKDKLQEVVSQWMENNTISGVPSDCQEMCDILNNVLNGSNSGSSASGDCDLENLAIQTALDQLNGTQDECTESKGGKNGNWLVVLASALGKQAGKQLKEMVELGEKMGSMDSKEDPEAFAETQSMFQAAAQLFKMFSEAISTMIKSIGEAMATQARKQ